MITTGDFVAASTAPNATAGITETDVNGADDTLGQHPLVGTELFDRLGRFEVELVHETGHHEQQCEHDRPEDRDHDEPRLAVHEITEGQQQHQATPNSVRVAAHSATVSFDAS